MSPAASPMFATFSFILAAEWDCIPRTPRPHFRRTGSMCPSTGGLISPGLSGC